MKYKKFEFDTYNVYTIKTDKFKNCHMEIMFYDNACSEELVLRNFLVDMLCHSSKKYPKRKDIVIKLEELYQSFFYGVTSKVGNMVLSNFVLDFLNPSYVQDEQYLKNVLQFPFEVIENPNVLDKSFDDRTFKIIQKRILADIESIKENPVNYAFRRALYHMDKDSITSKSILGTKEEVLKITPEALYEYYHKFYSKSLCNIYIIGNLDMDEVNKIIGACFHNRCMKNHALDPYIDNKRRSRELKVKETADFNQTSLVVGFNMRDLTREERFITLTLFDEILCSSGLNSKLYKALREENELCYSVSSIVSKYDNMFYVYVGLDKKNVSLAIKLIKKSMKEMMSGKISKEEFENAKKQLYTSLDIVVDNQNSLMNNYTFHSITGTPLYKDLKEKYELVTIKDLVNLGKKFKINFVYELESKGDDK